jgi:hypothetical protein
LRSCAIAEGAIGLRAEGSELLAQGLESRVMTIQLGSFGFFMPCTAPVDTQALGLGLFGSLCSSSS